MNEHEVTANLDSDKCFDQVRGWLSNCLNSHSKCTSGSKNESFHPTRLLDVGSGVIPPSCRVLECDREAQIGPYATLTYCWGTSNVEVLRTSNLEDWKRAVPISKLSQTIQHAVSIARKLQIRYLWIDALCILQDDTGDWLHESALITDIYSNSCLTIAATAAFNGEGCFFTRHPSLVAPCKVKGWVKADNRQDSFIVIPKNYWQYHVLDAPLYTRAWTLQERFLSPRIVHFAAEQILWECYEDMACESYPRGVPDILIKYPGSTMRTLDSLSDIKAYLNGDVKPQRDGPSTAAVLKYAVAALEEFWAATVESYTSCTLSYQRDILVAVSGISRRLAVIVRQPYIAGLWVNDELAVQLLWYVVQRHEIDLSTAAQPRSYYAPSWSWASVCASVEWILYSNNEYEEKLVDVLEAVTVPLTNDPFGQITSGFMRVEGFLAKVVIETVLLPEQRTSGDDVDYHVWIAQQKFSGYSVSDRIRPFYSEGAAIYLDTLQTPGESTTAICLPLFTPWLNRAVPGGWWKIAGLLLQPTGAGQDEYSRIGIFGLSTEAASAMLKLDMDEPKILESLTRAMGKLKITII